MNIERMSLTPFVVNCLCGEEVGGVDRYEGVHEFRHRVRASIFSLLHQRRQNDRGSEPAICRDPTIAESHTPYQGVTPPDQVRSPRKQ
jgi:hypothetical protein